MCRCGGPPQTCTFSNQVSNIAHGNTTKVREVVSTFCTRQVVSALEAMHRQGVWHRDIKPANVFLTTRGVVKVGDYGCAKLLTQGDNSSQVTRTLIGTPLSMAPEVISGEGYGAEADVWALGVLSYELLAMKRPFDGASMPQLAAEIGRAAPEPLCRAAPRVSRDVSRLVEGMLHRDPARRPSLLQVA